MLSHTYNMILKSILCFSSIILNQFSMVSRLFFIPSKLWTSVELRHEDTVPASKSLLYSGGKGKNINRYLYWHVLGRSDMFGQPICIDYLFVPGTMLGAGFRYLTKHNY